MQLARAVHVQQAACASGWRGGLGNQLGGQVIVKICEGGGVFQSGKSWPVCRRDTTVLCFEGEAAF